MITGKDAKKELVEARNVITDDKASADAKVRAVGKLVEVVLKVVLNNRQNLVKIMEKLEIEKVQPRKRDDEKTEPEKEEE